MISPLAPFFMTLLFHLYSVLKICFWILDIEIIILNTQRLQILEDSERTKAARRVRTRHKTEEKIISPIFYNQSYNKRQLEFQYL